MVKNIALVAHDSRKQELMSWIRFNAGSLKDCNLFCTGTTGRLATMVMKEEVGEKNMPKICLLYTSPSPRDRG